MQRRVSGGLGQGGQGLTPGCALESLAHCVRRLNESHDAFVDGLVQPFGISRAHVPLVLFLASGTRVANQNDIARHLGVDKGTVSRGAARLIQLGLVERQASRVDERACRLALTPRGLQLVEPLRSIDQMWQAGICEGIAETESVRVSRFLVLIAQQSEQLSREAQTGRMRLQPTRATAFPNTQAHHGLSPS